MKKEEEESDGGGGQAPPERWEPTPPSLRVTEAVEEQVSVAGSEASGAGWSTEEAAHTAEVPTRVAEVSGDATVAASAMASGPVKPSRKRKRGFSTLRQAIALLDTPFRGA
jgi:hypothetical protein